MNRLISAEWYRARKCNHIFIWTLGIIALFAYLGLYDSGLLIDNISVTDGFIDLISMSANAMIYTTLFVAGMLVVSYENKVLHYDMMAGNKISHIIISKLIITAPVVTLFNTLCIAVTSAIVANKNGIGDMKIFISYILVFTCITFRQITIAILIMTIFKGVPGMIIVFLRFTVLDALPVMIIEDLAVDIEKIAELLKFIPTRQYYYMNGCALESEFVGAVILSMIVEIGIWYVLSYISHKKKAFY